jgi:hypothetical protein
VEGDLDVGDGVGNHAATLRRSSRWPSSVQEFVQPVDSVISDAGKHIALRLHVVELCRKPRLRVLSQRIHVCAGARFLAELPILLDAFFGCASAALALC